MDFSTAIFAYLGPETVLPLTSAVAGAVGVAMLFGRNSLRWASKTIRGLASMAGPRPKPRAKAREIGKGPAGRIASPGSRRARA